MQLITGGMGFIGLHTARAFLDAGEDVVLTRYRTTREPSFLAGEFDKRVFVETVDLTNPHAVIEVAQKHHVTGIVHLAVPALQNVSAAEDYRNNMDGLINVLEAARVVGAGRVGVASSVSVYRGIGAGPFTEDMPVPIASANATSAYKKSFEILSRHYGDRTGIEVVCLRIGGIFGPLYHSLTNLPSRLVHAAMRGVPGPLPPGARANPHAEDLLDTCYAKDCGRAIQLLQMTPSLDHGIYNISAGQPVTANEMAGAVRAAVPDADIHLEPGRGPAFRADEHADISRLVEATGFTPAYSMVAAIADYVSWLGVGNEF